MKKKTKCYIYTRVSTAIQVDGYSLDAQKDKLRKYAEFQDMEIVGEYSDEGHSGKNIKGRQEFMRMLNDIEDGKDGVDFVLVFKLSRFGRKVCNILQDAVNVSEVEKNYICSRIKILPLRAIECMVLQNTSILPELKEQLDKPEKMVLLHLY